MMNLTTKVLVGTVAASAVSVIASAVANIVLYFANKKIKGELASARKDLDAVAKNLGKTVDELKKEEIEVDLSREIIDKLTYDKVTDKIERDMSVVERQAISEAKITLNAAVTKEINEQYGNTKGVVEEALRKKAADLDINGMKRDIERECVRITTQKYDKALDDEIQKFHDKLDREADKLVSQGSKEVESRLKLLESINDRLEKKA